MKKESKEELRDIEGIFPDGVMVGRDSRGFISVVETKGKESNANRIH